MAVGFGWVCIWSIRLLVNSKSQEIERIAADRDKFQQLLIDNWQSSTPEKVKKR
jgi:hypothetical protein